MTLKFPAASHAFVGMKLPPVMFPQPVQTVRSVKVPDPETRIVTTDQGSWTFRWDQMMVFPRRPDGSIEDWRREEKVPTLRDVVIGDILSCVDPKPQPGDPMIKVWEGRYQEVTRMWHSAAYGFVHLQTFEPATYATRTWHIHVLEPVVFPRVQGQVNDRYKNVDRNKKYGPYADKQTGNTYMFLVHPYGRGRWPANVDPFRFKQEVTEEVIICRPPSHRKGGWDQFILQEDSEPHPNDPYGYDRMREG